MKRFHLIHRSAAALTAAAVAAGLLPAMAADSVTYNTWTGYVLRDESGNYLSVPSRTYGEGFIAGFYPTNGVAPYNTWYFTEEMGGLTLKSAQSQGEYYLAVDVSGELVISTTPGVFTLAEDGTLYDQRGISYGQIFPEAVTNLRAGDLNQNGTVEALDLALLRQLIQQGNSSFVQTAVGDVTGDGALDAADAALLQQYLLGTDVTFAAIHMPENTIVITPEEPPATETTTALTETTTIPTETTTVPTETTTTTEITTEITTTTPTTTVPAEVLDMDDFPEEYRYAADWIWENRITAENSTGRWNTIFDQIVAGNGTLNFVVRWQSYKTITLEQRQQMETLIQDSIHGWTDWLSGWDGWEYGEVEVNIVGWAVLDRSVLEDLQPDEVVYDDLIEYYDSTYDTSNGYEEIPDRLPSAPSELSRFDHFTDPDYVYPGTRFDMYLWATQGFPAIGGCGGDWGQRLSDDAYLNMLDGTGIHVLEHEIGHGFGLTDFYGGEGESDGFPPGGFPGGENSLMMAGSAVKITDFDGWMLRYVWSQIKDEEGRFS